MERMTPRQFEIAQEIGENFTYYTSYENYRPYQAARIAQYFKAGPVDAQDENGKTLLHYLCNGMYQDIDMCDFLMDAFKNAFQYYPDPTIKDNNGHTPRMVLTPAAHRYRSCDAALYSLMGSYEQDYRNNYKYKRIENRLDKIESMLSRYCFNRERE